MRDEIHLWYVRPDQVTDPDLLARYAAMLSPEEAARQRRFMFAKDRHTYLVARALVRTVLSRYAEASPEAWVFGVNEYGKPYVAGGADLPPLRFNLSHADGLVACAVAMDHDLGVDAENVHRAVAVMDLARRYFSAREAADLERLPADLQRERFFDYWTLKEAYIKARGLGLSIPLDRIWFDLEAGRPPRIGFAPSVEDDPAAWQFAQFRPTSQHRMAVAVKQPSGQDWPVVVRQTVP